MTGEAQAAPPAMSAGRRRAVLASSVWRVFWAGAVVSALALLVTLALPRHGGGGKVLEPPREACELEACEPLAAEGD